MNKEFNGFISVIRPTDGDAMTGDASYPYLTSEDMRILPDDSLPVLEKPTGQIPVSRTHMK